MLSKDPDKDLRFGPNFNNLEGYITFPISKNINYLINAQLIIIVNVTNTHLNLQKHNQRGSLAFNH